MNKSFYEEKIKSEEEQYHSKSKEKSKSKKSKKYLNKYFQKQAYKKKLISKLDCCSCFENCDMNTYSSYYPVYFKGGYNYRGIYKGNYRPVKYCKNSGGTKFARKYFNKILRHKKEVPNYNKYRRLTNMWWYD